MSDLTLMKAMNLYESLQIWWNLVPTCRDTLEDELNNLKAACENVTNLLVRLVCSDWEQREQDKNFVTWIKPH